MDTLKVALVQQSCSDNQQENINKSCILPPVISVLLPLIHLLEGSEC